MKVLRNSLVLIIAVLFFGCTYLGIPTSKTVCDEPGYEDSYICALTAEMGTTPEDADLIFKIGALELLDKEGRAKALEVYAEAKEYLGAVRSYDAFVDFVRKEADLTGTTALLAKEFLSRLEQQPGNIIGKDLDMILYHIESTEELLKEE